MSGLETLRTTRKLYNEKQKHGEHLAEAAAHVPQPGKKPLVKNLKGKGRMTIVN